VLCRTEFRAANLQTPVADWFQPQPAPTPGPVL